jgi:DNA-binding response OmpR family regulator
VPETILLIDDDRRIAAALRIRLRAAGFDVVAASDGPSGLAAAEQHRPRAILLDIRMPGMNGFEVCRALKAREDLSDIPVIFLTANTKEKARESAHAAGASGFVSKPYDAKDVLAAIHTALAGAGSHGDLEESDGRKAG